ncbi:hypothetical protein J6590_087323 [Homalodisca vitripennis]|nr:hypothetical protein J6590_087323 [Homalodisca vitripennis]
MSPCREVPTVLTNITISIVYCCPPEAQLVWVLSLTEAVCLGPGQFLGAQCEDSCNPDLVHVFCDPETSRCECEHKYPVKLGPLKGCAKRKLTLSSEPSEI